MLETVARDLATMEAENVLALRIHTVMQVALAYIARDVVAS